MKKTWQKSFLPVLAFVLLAGLGISLYQRSGRRFRTESDKPADQKVNLPDEGLDWPIFRGSSGLLGVAESRLPESLDLLWTFATGKPVKSSAVIHAGRVYIGSQDKHLYALDFNTGEKIWAFAGQAGIEAPPTVVDDQVVIGDSDGMVYAVEAETGDLIWSHETGGEIAGAANVWVRPNQGTRLLIGSYDSKVHCLNADTGDPVWAFETGSYVNGTPAVSGDICAFGGCDAFVYVLRLSDANVVAKIDTGSYVASSVVLDEGRLYTGNFDGRFMCGSVADANQVWDVALENSEIYSSAAVTREYVIFGDRHNVVHCLRRDTGETVWTFKALGTVDSSPVVAGDKVVFGSDDGRLYVVGLADGQKQWSYEVGKPIQSSPAVAGHRIVIGCDDGNVYAFGAKM